MFAVNSCLEWFLFRAKSTATIDLYFGISKLEIPPRPNQGNTSNMNKRVNDRIVRLICTSLNLYFNCFLLICTSFVLRPEAHAVCFRYLLLRLANCNEPCLRCRSPDLRPSPRLIKNCLIWVHTSFSASTTSSSLSFTIWKNKTFTCLL